MGYNTGPIPWEQIRQMGLITRGNDGKVIATGNYAMLTTDEAIEAIQQWANTGTLRDSALHKAKALRGELDDRFGITTNTDLPLSALEELNDWDEANLKDIMG